MASDQIKRFERWRRFLPKNSAYFVTLILEEIVPLFRAKGFDRFKDYAGGSTFAVGGNNIPLQRRSGSEWPTVEIRFHYQNPSIDVSFGALPEICCRVTAEGTIVEIPRIEASVVDGPAVFHLCKGKNNFRNFGYSFFAFSPKRKLDKEIIILKSLLPWLFSTLECIPEAWFRSQPGYVDPHAFLNPASRMFRKWECAERMLAKMLASRKASI